VTILLTCTFEGALGGTRTPNLLIRRDLQGHPLQAHMLSTCWNAAQRCATAGGVERYCEAKIRPLGGRAITERWTSVDCQDKLDATGVAASPDVDLPTMR